MPLPTWLTRPVIYAIAAVVAALAIWWLVATLLGGKRAEVQAKLNGNIAGAALESGKDAVNTVGQQQASEGAVGALGRDNAAAIHNASGSSASVSPEANAAGIAAICKRASARSDPKCAKP